MRVLLAERLLSCRGLSANVTLAGHEDDVLAVRAPVDQLDEIRQVTPELKKLGFRYVALELDTEGGSGA